MLDSLADLHWKLGNSSSAFADWNSALALQPKEALRTAIQARARGALMALLRGERDTNPMLALAVYRQHADLLAGQEKDAVAMLAARLDGGGSSRVRDPHRRVGPHWILRLHRRPRGLIPRD